MDAPKGIGTSKRYYDSKRKIRRRRNHILAIGIGEYQDYNRLVFPVRECRSLIETLIKHYDFEPEPRKALFDSEATCDAIYTELYNLDDLTNNDNLIILFSGHGFYDRLKDNGYWVPVDGKKLNTNNGRIDTPSILKRYYISVSDIIDNLNTVKAHHIILIVDSCFAGKFTRFNLRSPGGAYNQENVPAEELPSRWAITSGLIEKVPDKSLFAQALLNVLNNPIGEKLSIYSLFAQIEDKIEQSGPYSPSLYPIVEANLRGGKFAFYRRKSPLASILEIDRELLAEGSLDYLYQLESGRFKILTISDLLLPKLEHKWLKVEVEATDEKENLPLQLAIEEHKQESNPHIILFGSGGMGKTVSFIRLWQEWRDHRQGPIPIFIALNEYNSCSEADRKHFIFRYIHRNYLHNAIFSEAIIEKLWALLINRPNDNPEFVFLLDGFNEITVDKTLLIEELEEIITKAKNIQILVTSRLDLNVESFHWVRNFNRISFRLIEIGRIEEYLKRAGIEDVPADKKLLDLLGNPMMLTLYAGTSEWQKRSSIINNFEFFFKPTINSSGELLWNFIEAQLAKLAEDNPGNYQNLVWKSFLLRHLLPYLGHKMAEFGQFQFFTRSKQQMELSFTATVNDGYEWLESNNFFELYPYYKSFRSLLKVGLDRRNVVPIEARSRDIRIELVDNLHFLVREANSLRFLHQIFRDYFAAVHIQKSLEFTVAQNQGLEPPKRRFPPELRQKPIDLYVRGILGELEGEHDYEATPLHKEKHKNKTFSNPANLLGQVFELCRGVFDEQKLGYTLWNILSIWKEQHRKQLVGSDLRALQLKDQLLYDVRLSEMHAESSLTASIISDENFFVKGHTGKINKAIFSPDSQKIATVSSDGMCKIWNARTSKLLATLGTYKKPVFFVDFNSDGSRVATGSYHGTIEVWDVSSGLCLQTLEISLGKLKSLRFSPDDASIYTTTDKGVAERWDVASGVLILRQRPELPEEDWETHTIKFGPRAKFVVTNYRGSIKLWDFQSGRKVSTFEELDSYTKIGEFNHNESSLLVWNYNRVFILNIASKKLKNTVLLGHSEPIHSACFSPNGNQILTSANDSVKLWDEASGQCLVTLENTKYSKGACFSVDGKNILTFGTYTRIWDADNGTCLLDLQGFGTGNNNIHSVKFANNLRTIFASSSDGTESWHLHLNRCMSKTLAKSGSQSAIDRSGQYLLSANSEKAFLIDLNTGVSTELVGHSRMILSLAINGDGSLVATGAWDYFAKIWDSKSGKCLLTFNGDKKKITSLAFSPDGKLLATAASKSKAIAKPNRPSNWVVMVWNIETGKKLATLRGATTMEKLWGRFVDKKLNQGHTSTITTSSFSPDGRLIGTGSDDNMAKIWEVKTGRLRFTLQGHSDTVQSICFSPDGLYLATGSADKTIRIWKVRTGKPIMILEGHTGKVNCIDYDRSGQKILSGSSNGEIKLWNIKTGSCIVSLKSYRGLLIQGCDFRNLHPNSSLSDSTIEILKSHGGIFSDEDAQKWEELKGEY